MLRETPAPPAPLRKSDLSPAQQCLIGLLSRIHFGRIEGLAVLDGQPIFDPAPRIIRTLKMNGRNYPRAASAAPDFLLKSEVAELLDHISQVGDGIIQRIEIAHGIPLLLEVRDGTVPA